MFKRASRLKLRFRTVKGDVSTEDLWDIPLTSRTTGFSLNDLAKSLSKAVKEDAEEDFVAKKSAANSVLDLKFSIVKEVIKDRLEERELNKNRVAAKAQKEKILSIIASKEDEALLSMDIEELKKMVV